MLFFYYFLEKSFDNVTNERYINHMDKRLRPFGPELTNYSNLTLRKVSYQMKKMILALGALAAATIVTSCAAVAVNNGMPAPGAIGANFFSTFSANALIAPIQSDFTVVKHGVTAEGKYSCFFTAFNFGDASFETLKKEALKDAAGADDIIDVRVDYDMNCICGINTVTVKLTGTAIKYK